METEWTQVPSEFKVSRSQPSSLPKRTTSPSILLFLLRQQDVRHCADAFSLSYLNLVAATRDGHPIPARGTHVGHADGRARARRLRRVHPVAPQPGPAGRRRVGPARLHRPHRAPPRHAPPRVDALLAPCALCRRRLERVGRWRRRRRERERGVGGADAVSMGWRWARATTATAPAPAPGIPAPTTRRGASGHRRGRRSVGRLLGRDAAGRARGAGGPQAAAEHRDDGEHGLGPDARRRAPPDRGRDGGRCAQPSPCTRPAGAPRTRRRSSGVRSRWSSSATLGTTRVSSVEDVDVRIRSSTWTRCLPTCSPIFFF